MEKSIAEWKEIIEKDKHTICPSDMFDMLKDYFSARDEEYDIEELIEIRDFIKSDEGKKLIAKYFNCTEKEIALESVSINNMADLDKYKVVLGSLSLDGISAGDTGKVKFVGGAVYFGYVNPSNIAIKYICGDVFFGNDYVDTNEIQYIGGNIYAENAKLQEECAKRFGATFEDQGLI